MFERLLRTWDGEALVTRYYEPLDASIFVALHSTLLGPATGGARMRTYPSTEAAIAEVMRLSSDMTKKTAACNIPLGGGKSVIAVKAPPEGVQRRELLLNYAELLQTLGGAYLSGPDMGIGPADIDIISEATSYVGGGSRENGGGGETGYSTARGVLSGIRTSLKFVFGSDALTGRTVYVQGVGTVGAALVSLLTDAGAGVLISDIDVALTESVAANSGAAVVEQNNAAGVECDVYSPCSIPGTINSESIPTLRCKIIAGGANSQLAKSSDAELLEEAGILYAPDFIVSAGGILQGATRDFFHWSEEELASRIEAIGPRLLGIYEDARRRGITTETVAQELAARKLDAWRKKGRV